MFNTIYEGYLCGRGLEWTGLRVMDMLILMDKKGRVGQQQESVVFNRTYTRDAELGAMWNGLTRGR